mmetsp:Transcript_13638/g.38840  ORF Transcript_13638/g.38840 Transcript_13638/m.38840 type:complete len:356 (+) Transcript_13638:569-1636(+)
MPKARGQLDRGLADRVPRVTLGAVGQECLGRLDGALPRAPSERRHAVDGVAGLQVRPRAHQGGHGRARVLRRQHGAAVQGREALPGARRVGVRPHQQQEPGRAALRRGLRGERAQDGRQDRRGPAPCRGRAEARAAALHRGRGREVLARRGHDRRVLPDQGLDPLQREPARGERGGVEGARQLRGHVPGQVAVEQQGREDLGLVGLIRAAREPGVEGVEPLDEHAVPHRARRLRARDPGAHAEQAAAAQPALLPGEALGGQHVVPPAVQAEPAEAPAVPLLDAPLAVQPVDDADLAAHAVEGRALLYDVAGVDHQECRDLAALHRSSASRQHQQTESEAATSDVAAIMLLADAVQ